MPFRTSRDCVPGLTARSFSSTTVPAMGRGGALCVRRSSGMNARVVEEPRIGLSVARNTGWRHAEGGLSCTPMTIAIRRGLSGTGQPLFLRGRSRLIWRRGCCSIRTTRPVTIQSLEQRVDILPGSYLPTGLVHGPTCFPEGVLDRVGGSTKGWGRHRASCGEDTTSWRERRRSGFAAPTTRGR